MENRKTNVAQQKPLGRKLRSILPDVLHAIKSLLYTATNQTLHERFLPFFRGRSMLGRSIHRDLTWRPVFANRFVFNKSFAECESPFCLRSLCRWSRHFRLNARLRPTFYCERVPRKLLRQQSVVVNTGKNFTGTSFKRDWISTIVQLRFQVYMTNLSLGLLINGQHCICNICRPIFLPFHLQNCENRFHM